MTSFPFVSIVINTLNRCDLLEDALIGISQLAYPNFEIVVVNGPSNDDTPEVLQRWSTRIKIGSCATANLSRSRNIGISLASGDIVAFIDDDAVPHPSWLARLALAYADPRIGAVGGFTIGASGVAYQARKTVCDRYGDGYYVSDYFDERQLNTPGSWIFPSLLGTNSSFRRTALTSIGGFDEVFTYFLDETDVCVRLLDAGWLVIYEPTALIWHRSGRNAQRNEAGISTSILAQVRSQSYFIHRHGLHPWSLARAIDTNARLQRLTEQCRDRISTLRDAGQIGDRESARLGRELTDGMEQGIAAARDRVESRVGHLTIGPPPPVKPFVRDHSGLLSVCLISRYYPPGTEAGIARWTALLAGALAELGHTVHVITEAGDTPRISFRRGVWLHEIPLERSQSDWLVEDYDVPQEIAAWAEAVRRRVAVIKGFGIDLVSFPIWDLEGIGCFGDPDLPVAMSLHTTYALADPFKPDWRRRPVYRDDFVRRLISAERNALQRADLLLANSRSIVRDIERIYSVDIAAKTAWAVHGVPIPSQFQFSAPQSARDSSLRVLFVGRFEFRKGIDIAIRAISLALQHGTNLTAEFVGGESNDNIVRTLEDETIIVPDGIESRMIFRGIVDRSELDTAYANCDVVLMPSRYESFGLVIIEAFAHGRPVIVLEGGAPAEIVENRKTGFVVQAEPHSAEAIAELLGRLAADREGLLRMGASARSVAESQFSVAVMAKQAEEAFRKIVMKRAR